MKSGDRVHHETTGASFGFGTVVDVDLHAGTALVRWDTHRVRRVTDKLQRDQTHVDIASLSVVAQ